MNSCSGLDVHFEVRKTASHLELHANRSVASLDLCPSDFAILDILRHRGPTPVNTLGREIMLTSGSITTAIHRLTERGFVRREWQEHDKRVCAVVLTEAGSELIKKCFRGHAATMETIAAGLSDEERRTLISLLQKLRVEEQGMVKKVARTTEPRQTAAKISEPSETVQFTNGFDGFNGLD